MSRRRANDADVTRASRASVVVWLPDFRSLPFTIRAAITVLILLASAEPTQKRYDRYQHLSCHRCGIPVSIK